MKRRLLILVPAAVCAAVLLVLWLLPVKTPQTGERLKQAAEGLDEIAIQAAYDPDAQTLAVSQTLTLTNRTGADLDNLALRTYAAAFRDEEYAPSATEELHSRCYPGGFSAGGLEITDCDFSYEYTDDAHTVLMIGLNAPWKNGATLSFQLAYTLTIPDAAYRFGVNEGICALGNAFVIPAVYADSGWQTDEYYSIGDPFISECRNYTVRLTLPRGYTAAGTGAAETDGQTVIFTAPAVRDFALCISKAYQKAQAVQDGVLIEAYAKTFAQAKTMLGIAQKAMQTYTGLYGGYPYPSFTLAEVSLPFDGMTYPSLAMIDSDVLSLEKEAREIRIAREIAKQWFEAVVGTDGYNQAWQHEALAEYALLDYWEAQHGASARDSLQYTRVDIALRLTVGDLTPGSPLDYFYDWSEYQTVVWHRGAAALCALQLALEGHLDEFIGAYYDTYAFQIASRRDFEQALKAFSGEDWSPLFTDYLDTMI